MNQVALVANPREINPNENNLTMRQQNISSLHERVYPHDDVPQHTKQM